MAFFSIIIPTYNVEIYIERCIKSVLQQNYKDFEVIVIDDCSTDETIKRVKKNILDDNTNLRILQNPENQGVSFSRNIGLHEANGDFIVFLDADDWLDTDYLERIYLLIKQYDLDLLYTSILKFVYEDGSTTQIDFTKHIGFLRTNLDWDNFFNNYQGYSWLYIARKSLFDNIIYPVNCSMNEDMLTSFKLVLRSHNFYIADFLGYNYFQRKGSISKSFDPKLKNFVGELVQTRKYWYGNMNWRHIDPTFYYKITISRLHSCLSTLLQKEDKEKSLLILKQWQKDLPLELIIWAIKNSWTRSCVTILLLKISPSALIIVYNKFKK